MRFPDDDVLRRRPGLCPEVVTTSVPSEVSGRMAPPGQHRIAIRRWSPTPRYVGARGAGTPRVGPPRAHRRAAVARSQPGGLRPGGAGNERSGPCCLLATPTPQNPLSNLLLFDRAIRGQTVFRFPLGGLRPVRVAQHGDRPGQRIAVFRATRSRSHALWPHANRGVCAGYARPTHDDRHLHRAARARPMAHSDEASACTFGTAAAEHSPIDNFLSMWRWQAPKDFSGSMDLFHTRMALTLNTRMP